MTYIPSTNLWDKISSLNQGFIIQKDPEYVISIKLEPSILNSIIDGCLIEIGIVKEYYGVGLTMLIIEDIPQQPFYVIGENFSKKDSKLTNYDEVIIDIFNQQQIILALFNLDSTPIYSKELKLNLEVTKQELIEWLATPPSNHNNLTLFNPNDIFPINLNNFEDKRSDKKIFIYKPEPFSFEKGEYNVITSIENDTEKGRHGYSQEQAIRNILINHFELGNDYFESPIKSNGEELTDSLIVLDKSLILIESKYVISSKQNKKNIALRKAINQLNNAEEYILINGFENILKTNEYNIIKICIVDAKLFHHKSKLPENLYQEHPNLPIVFTLSSFNNMLGSYMIKYKNWTKPFEQDLIKMWKEKDKSKLLIVNPF
ncbi:hypothetical protein [Chryseobacterium balustinum]|uniref:hypothetical protein n=1 Tax=Chryseobacterium balustinum TaxID=246 RepID=UPI003CFB9314